MLCLRAACWSGVALAGANLAVVDKAPRALCEQRDLTSGGLLLGGPLCHRAGRRHQAGGGDFEHLGSAVIPYKGTARSAPGQAGNKT